MKLYSAVFYSNDIDTVEGFYKSLGFEVDYRAGDKFISFKIGEDGRLGIKRQVEEREIPGHQTVFIQVDEIESFYEEIKSTKPEILLKPLTKEAWATEFTVLDPDGNKVLFRSN